MLPVITMHKFICICTAFFVILFASCAKADLVMVPTGDLLLGSQTLSNVEGTGLNLGFSFSGDITTDGSITYAGNNIDGFGTTRFGWEGVINSGVFQMQTSAFRVDALNGTFDGSIGFEKNLGNINDLLWIESDGVFDLGTSGQWTQVGNRIEFAPGGILPFNSSDPGNGFTPSVTGASYLEFTANSFLDFGGAYSQQFDLNFTSATVSGIPEPTSGLLFGSIVIPMMLRRRRES